jgi:hypothetical protein
MRSSCLRRYIIVIIIIVIIVIIDVQNKILLNIEGGALHSMT